MRKGKTEHKFSQPPLWFFNVLLLVNVFCFHNASAQNMYSFPGIDTIELVETQFEFSNLDFSFEQINVQSQAFSINATFVAFNEKITWKQLSVLAKSFERKFNHIPKRVVVNPRKLLNITDDEDLTKSFLC